MMALMMMIAANTKASDYQSAFRLTELQERLPACAALIEKVDAPEIGTLEELISELSEHEYEAIYAIVNPAEDERIFLFVPDKEEKKEHRELCVIKRDGNYGSRAVFIELSKDEEKAMYQEVTRGQWKRSARFSDKVEGEVVITEQKAGLFDASFGL